MVRNRQTTIGNAREESGCRAMVLDVDAATRTHLDRLVGNLHSEFDELFSREEVDAAVAVASEQFRDTAKFGDFVPLLVYRAAREQLRARGQAEGKIAKLVTEVLFVTLTDTGRGHIAAALLEQHAGGSVSARTAGTAAEQELNPIVVEVLGEAEVDVSLRHPKPLTENVLRAADVVVSMLDEPINVPDVTHHEVWDVEDPRGKDIETVRLIRDDIDVRVRKLAAELAEQSENASGAS
jgi:arsenate reductase (thioredoxin)